MSYSVTAILWSYNGPNKQGHFPIKLEIYVNGDRKYIARDRKAL